MTANPLDDALSTVLAIADLTARTWKTPGAGNTSKPFKVRKGTQSAGVEVTTSKGGTITLRPEAFDGAVKALSDLGVDDPDGWVRVSDEALLAVLSSENREHGVASYVLPLLEGAGLVELDRGRPARARARRA
jgi:hypothetical protein